jgi:hypothetical protein
MIYRGWKGRRYQTTTLTSQNVQQKSTNRVNFIGDVRLCELFSVGFNKMFRNKLILTLWSLLWEDDVVFPFWILKFRTNTQFYRYAHKVYVEKRLRKSFSVLSSVSVTFLSKWRLRELPTATGFSVI